SLFDAVVIGAPELLTERDIVGLETFLRRRGGAVCLLLDQRIPGPYERLLGTSNWSTTTSATTIEKSAAEPLRLLATELASPVTLPPGGQPIASNSAIWTMPIGSGRVVVSGVLDAWRFRDAATATFDRFWQSTVADIAAASPALVDVSVEHPLLSPGESSEATIVLRDESLADLSAGRSLRGSVHVELETPQGPIALRAWPEGAPGVFRATLQAPATTGTYRLSVTGNGTRVTAPIVVESGVHRALPDERDL